jgi:hypothetical protein
MAGQRGARRAASVGETAQLCFELETASPWCQRWRERRHSWRHRSEGGFRAERYAVAPVGQAAARAFCGQHHYAGQPGPVRLSYGLFDLWREGAGGDAGALAGIAALTVPMQEAVVTHVFPDLAPITESVELGRFVLLDEVPANAETWFLARTFQGAAERGIRGVVSFADPVPRRDRRTGEVVFHGHRGVIYTAANALYLGRGTPRTLILLPDGSSLNARSLQKVRGCEARGEAVVRRLVDLGARAPGRGVGDARWLADALDQVGAYRIRHRGCHRYAFRLGLTRRDREAIRIAPEAREYPRVLDAAA